MDILEVLRAANVLCLGLLMPPLIILGFRRRNPGIIALAIFAVTGALGTYEEFGMPYPGFQFPARMIAVGLVVWWLMREWNDPDYPHPQRWKDPDRAAPPVDRKRYRRPYK